MTQDLRSRGLLAGAVWLGLLCGAAGAGHAPVGEPPSLSGPEITRDILAETRLYCLALAVYFEGGSTVETEEGQRHIARVVAERAKANRRKWGGADVCDVVFYRRNGVCQFSFACLPAARRTPRGGPAWRYSLAIAQDELEERSTVQERLIRYYMNPALTPDRNACRFRKEFVPVVEAGRHQFFREPTQAELAALAREEPIECKRLAEALEAKKRAVLEAKKRLALKAKKLGSKAKKRFAQLSGKHKGSGAKAKHKARKVKYAGR
jgi:Cell Wall Hydrolase